MSHYVIEKNLSTTGGQKFVSGIVSLCISALLILLLWFMKIVVPNPPFENKKGELELDFGMEEVSYGNPKDGGPSETPPAKGGEAQSVSSQPTSTAPSGGHGEIVNTNDQTEETAYPSVNPPASKEPQVNSRVSAFASKLGKRDGSNGDGSPKGIDGGHGSEGYGPGGNNGGITGAGGTKVTRNRGNGFFTPQGFTSYDLNSNVRDVPADGVGDIVARVRVKCDGDFDVVAISPNSTFTGGDQNAKEVMNSFLQRSHFIKVGDKCPETGTVTLHVKKG